MSLPGQKVSSGLGTMKRIYGGGVRWQLHRIAANKAAETTYYAWVWDNTTGEIDWNCIIDRQFSGSDSTKLPREDVWVVDDVEQRR